MPQELSTGLDAACAAAVAVADTDVDWSEKVNAALALLRSANPAFRLIGIPVACGRVNADGTLDEVSPVGYLTSARGARAAGHYTLTIADANNAKKMILASAEAATGAGADPYISEAQMLADYASAQVYTFRVALSAGTIALADRVVDFMIFEC